MKIKVLPPVWLKQNNKVRVNWRSFDSCLLYSDWNSFSKGRAANSYMSARQWIHSYLEKYDSDGEVYIGSDWGGGVVTLCFEFESDAMWFALKHGDLNESNYMS